RRGEVPRSIGVPPSIVRTRSCERRKCRALRVVRRDTSRISLRFVRPAPWRAGAVRAPRCARGLMLAPRGFPIDPRRAQKERIVAEEAKPGVALAAKQAANHAGNVTMIDVKPHARLPADGAGVALPLEDGAKLLEREPIAAGALAVAKIRV